MQRQSQSTKFQYFAAISADLIVAGLGCGIGWLSMALPLLQSDETPLETGPLTVEDVSWIGSILSVGSSTGILLFGYLVSIFGSKKSILLLGLPQFGSWLLLINGRRAIDLYAARFLTGIVSGGAQFSLSLYIAEIADNSIRGQLGTIFQFSRNFGFLFASVLGLHFNYIISSYFFTAITIGFYGTFLFLPSTPQYLLKNNQPEKAEKSLRFYKGYKDKDDPKLYEAYFDNLKYVANGLRENSSASLKELWDSRRSFIQALLFPLLAQLVGAYTFLTYGTSIVEKSGTHLPAQYAAISLAVVQLVGTFLTSQLVDRKGRKFLLILSMSGCALGHASMVLYLYLFNNGFDTSSFHWMPVVCMGFIILIASVGIVPLTLICLVECFPVKIRPIGMLFGSAVDSVSTFFIAGSFPILMELIGLQGCLMIFATCCAFGTVYMAICVEETKGKELNVLKRSSTV